MAEFAGQAETLRPRRGCVHPVCDCAGLTRLKTQNTRKRAGQFYRKEHNAAEPQPSGCKGKTRRGILTTKYTEYTKMEKGVFVSCILCISWFKENGFKILAALREIEILQYKEPDG
jgi:hypothetical protein